jgi:drug/metabolite transporter (DMT)-like permease
MKNDAATHNRAEVTRATLIGLFAIFIWGPSVPLARIMMSKLDLIGYLALVNFISGLCGLIKNAIQKTKVFTPEVVKNPLFYIRWLCYVVYILCIGIAIKIVSSANFSLLILLNYLWPTAVILCSILLSAVRITHRWALALGSLIVIASLSLELLSPALFKTHLVLGPYDLLAFGLAIVNAVLWGFASAITRKHGKETGGGGIVPYYQLTFGLGLPFYFMSRNVMLWQLPLWVSLGLVALGILFFIAHQSWSYGMHHGSVVMLSLCADFIPWLSLLSAHLFLGVDITVTTTIAAFILVVGAMITRYGTL